MERVSFPLSLRSLLLCPVDSSLRSAARTRSRIAKRICSAPAKIHLPRAPCVAGEAGEHGGVGDGVACSRGYSQARLPEGAALRPGAAVQLSNKTTHSIVWLRVSCLYTAVGVVLQVQYSLSRQSSRRVFHAMGTTTSR